MSCNRTPAGHTQCLPDFAHVAMYPYAECINPLTKETDVFKKSMTYDVDWAVL